MSKILEKIDMDKEVLSTMPKNNKKNISKYIQYVQELKQDYSSKSFSEISSIIFGEIIFTYSSFNLSFS